MIELLSNPAVWASFATLTILEIVLGVDNVIFISITPSQAACPNTSAPAPGSSGLRGALVLRVLLLASIAWIVGPERSPSSPLFGFDPVAGAT